MIKTCIAPWLDIILLAQSYIANCIERNCGRGNLTHTDSKRPKTSDNKMLLFALTGGLFLCSIV
ncbi:hypothetical protein [Clostridium tagluense]|uniref:hypothetical protein n=1 Tax=Clostridium tagluense TaxID=360422 RepID=UPI001CF0F32A|nr:hypothetical protein [Clostridium tagluense]MCB2299327.1 hypothetical protein [Clostridium tagluense]